MRRGAGSNMATATRADTKPDSASCVFSTPAAVALVSAQRRGEGWAAWWRRRELTVHLPTEHCPRRLCAPSTAHAGVAVASITAKAAAPAPAVCIAWVTTAGGAGGMAVAARSVAGSTAGEQARRALTPHVASAAGLASGLRRCGAAAATVREEREHGSECRRSWPVRCARIAGAAMASHGLLPRMWHSAMPCAGRRASSS